MKKKGKMFDGKVFWRAGIYNTESKAIDEAEAIKVQKDYIFGGSGPFLTRITEDDGYWTVWVRGVNWASY